MNLKKYLIVLSMQLLISCQLALAEPYEYSVDGTSYYYVTDVATGEPVPGSPFLAPNNAVLVDVEVSTDGDTAYMIDQHNGTLIAVSTTTNQIINTTSLELQPYFYPVMIMITGDTAYIGVLEAPGGVDNTWILPVDITDPLAPVIGYIFPFSDLTSPTPYSPPPLLPPNAPSVVYVAPPMNVVGVRGKNTFLFQVAPMVTITWSASSAYAVSSYNIYNGTTRLGTVLAVAPLTFNAFVPAGDNGNNLSVTAVSSLGGESARTPVVIA